MIPTGTDDGSPPLLAKKLVHPPTTTKGSFLQYKQCSCHNLIKTSLLAVIIAPISILTQYSVQTGHANLDFNSVQYLQGVVFSFKKVRMVKITRQIPTTQ